MSSTKLPSSFFYPFTHCPFGLGNSEGTVESIYHILFVLKLTVLWELRAPRTSHTPILPRLITLPPLSTRRERSQA